MKKIIPVFRVIILFFAVYSALGYVMGPESFEKPMVTVFLIVVLFFLITLEFMIKTSNIIINALLTDEQRAIEANKSSCFGLFGSKKRVSEEELLLEHDYDGIKELDNNLPTWWVYLFYATAIFAVVYFINYEIMGGNTQEDSFREEMEQAKIAVEEYKKNSPDLIDEKTVIKLTDAASLEEGKAIFVANCAVCHRADAGGQIGPNLTDDHWIFGGAITDLFKTVTNGGRDGKGMVSWKAILKPTQIQQVTSYILSLQGTHPADAKPPVEGENPWVATAE